MQDNIPNLIAAGRLDEALDGLRAMPQDDDRTQFLLGQVLWRMDRRGEAMSAYNRAVALNPNSPARAAIEHSEQIMDYYHRDLYNP